MKKGTWQGRTEPPLTENQPPNKRGKGGRPTTGQLAEQGKLDAGRETLQTVQQAQPPLRIEPSQTKWARDYAKEEKLVEQEEAEAILAARKERLEAIEDQTTVLRANRRIALGFSGAAMQLLKTMQKAAKELDDRVSNGVEDMSLKDLREIIGVTGTTVAKAQSAVEAMVKTERYVTRHPLDLTEEEQDDLDSIDQDGAKLILENLSKSIHHISKRFARDNAIDVVPESVEVKVTRDET